MKAVMTFTILVDVHHPKLTASDVQYELESLFSGVHISLDVDHPSILTENVIANVDRASSVAVFVIDDNE